MNKLGLNDLDILDVEEALVDFKASLIDEKVSFNQTTFDLYYLIKLNEFLLGDLYYYAGQITNGYDNQDLFMINSKISDIVNLISHNTKNEDEILALVKELINMQLFGNGNKRTILVFLRNVINVYKSYDEEYYSSLLDNITENVEALFRTSNS